MQTRTTRTLKRPIVFVFVGPSGSGKDSVANEVCAQRHFSVARCRTATTRKPRRGKKKEINGIHYDFHTKPDFAKLRRLGYFIESEQVHGNHWYGTPRKNLRELTSTGKNVILSIDINGLDSLKECSVDDIGDVQIVSIFIRVEDPWEENLRARIISRNNGITPSDIEERMQTARTEMNRAVDCTHTVTNRHGQLEATIDEVLEIMDSYMPKAA